MQREILRFVKKYTMNYGAIVAMMIACEEVWKIYLDLHIFSKVSTSRNIVYRRIFLTMYSAMEYGSDGTDIFACGSDILQTSTLVSSVQVLQVDIVSRVLPYREGPEREKEKKHNRPRTLRPRSSK